jgi:hypothetical protein
VLGFRFKGVDAAYAVVGYGEITHRSGRGHHGPDLDPNGFGQGQECGELLVT